MGGPETGPGVKPETVPATALFGGDTKPIRVKRYCPGLALTIDLPAAERGTFIHRCFEVLGARPDLKVRLPAATGVAVDAEALERIAKAVAAFEAWLQAEFQPTAVRREWPLAALAAQGTLVFGTADLVVVTAQGCWVIDHKSDRVDDPIQGYQGYWPQLSGYADALSATGRRILGTAIHWTQRGEVVLESW